MDLRETVKHTFEHLTGRNMPAISQVRQAVHMTAPEMFRFTDDGAIPNNPILPMLLFPQVIDLDPFADPAAPLEVLFEAHGWGDGWRNGIYDYVHYHARIHEVLGIACGRARVRFGGDHGTAIVVTAGDVVVLPAGTGHQCLTASRDFLVVGAYPPDGSYDECRGNAHEHERALRSVPEVPMPEQDPVFGQDGPLRRVWGRR